MMKNCNLELGLFPPCSDDSGEESHQQGDKHRQITIFYAGKICVSDVTELQAKSILMLANKKVEEKASSPMTPIPSGSKASSPPPRTVQCNNNNNHVYGTGTGLSMKKSLQRFLQKRKIRIQEASPYNH